MPSAQIPWNRRGLCVNAEPDAMFVTGAAQREAARLCAGCPVRMECLADSLDNRIEFGVWGGMTERQRRALLKERPDVYSWLAVLQEAREAAVRSAAS
ncbi:WhiB family transcriptional regulator [Nakamurella silvestris]|nr:WhiB family transcriptional regulator [Nakamurella silvestris]